MASHRIYLGTYTRNGSRGIYHLELDARSGALSAPSLAAEASNPAWITLSPDRRILYAIHESEAQAIGYTIDPATGALRPLPRTGAAAALAERPASPPSHLALDATGRTLLAANYRDGYVASLPLHAGGTPGAPQRIPHTGRGPHPTRQDKPHPHSVTLSPDNRYVIVCDLGVDRIFTYALDSATARLTPAEPAFVATAPGAGPRHFKFGLNGRQAYAINELDNTIVVYDYEPDPGALTPHQVVPTLPPGVSIESTTAEIRVHPNGRFLYGSNRGHDSLASYAIDPATGRLTPIEIVPSAGRTPRNFALSPDGDWLVCAHQDSGDVTVFRVDPATGRLTRLSSAAQVPMGVCVLFAS